MLLALEFEFIVFQFALELNPDNYSNDNIKFHNQIMKLTKVFYDGTEQSYGDAATVGKVSGFEFLFEADYKRRFGNTFLDQQHFLRYVADHWIVKIEYMQQGFADIKYFESSQRYRQKVGDKFSWNIGIVQRISEPYGYNPLEEFILPNGSLH